MAKVQYFGEMQRLVREAFRKAWERDHPRKKEKGKSATAGPVEIGSETPWLDSDWIAEDHVIFQFKGKQYKLPYTGGPDNPAFGDTRKAVRIEMQPVEVEEPPAKEDNSSLRAKANRWLKETGKEELDEDEPIPGWLISKLEKQAGKGKSKKTQAQLASARAKKRAEKGESELY